MVFILFCFFLPEEKRPHKERPISHLVLSLFACLDARGRRNARAKVPFSVKRTNPAPFFFQSVGTSLRPSGAACRVYLTKRPEKALPQPVVYKKAHLQTQICTYEKTNDLLHFDFESTPPPQKWWTFAESRRKMPFPRLLSRHSSPRRLKISACRPKARKKIVFLHNSMVSRRRILPTARRLHLITPLCPTTTPLPFPPNRRSSVSPSTNSPP